MKRLRLTGKLALGFGCLMAIATVLGIVNYYSSNQAASTITDITGVQLPSVKALLTISDAANIIKACQGTLLGLDIDPAIRRREWETLAKAREQYNAAFKAFEGLPKLAEEEALWAEVKTAWQTWNKENEVFLRLYQGVDALKVGNPLRLENDLSRFRADHFILENQVLKLCATKKAFEGGEDPAACRFGKWQAAQQIQNADITRLLKEITDSHQKFHAGVKKSKELVAGGNLEGANKVYVEEVDPMVAEVASASQQQSQGISQVNTAVSQMDKVTQSNAASAEESASAAEELNAQAQNLQGAVTQLLALVEGQGDRHASRPAPNLPQPASSSRPGNGKPAPAPLPSSRKVQPAPARHPGPVVSRAAATKIAKANAIPLDGDFKDF